MNAIAQLIGSIFLFLGIICSLDAKELHMLGFREEGEEATQLSVALAIVGFCLWMAGQPSLEVPAVLLEPWMLG